MVLITNYDEKLKLKPKYIKNSKLKFTNSIFIYYLK